VGTWEASLPKEHDLRVHLNNAQSLAHFCFYLPTNQSTVHYGTILSNGMCVFPSFYGLFYFAGYVMKLLLRIQVVGA
jgi:hypothetical protein